jgi:hypothetical protein
VPYQVDGHGGPLGRAMTGGNICYVAQDGLRDGDGPLPRPLPLALPFTRPPWSPHPPLAVSRPAPAS